MTIVVNENTIENMEISEGQPESKKQSDICTCIRKSIRFSVIFLFEVVAIFSHCKLCYDVWATEKGLVYGPSIALLRYLILAFTVIGALTSLFAVVNRGFECFRSNPLVKIDKVLLITIWIGEVPMTLMNVFIFECREEAISYYQLLKATIAVSGPPFRLVARYCRCSKCKCVNTKSSLKSFGIIIGFMILTVGSILVFLFTFYEQNPDGLINFKIPNSLTEDKYDDKKYFKSVSIYLSHEMFDTEKNNNTENINLVKLLMINDIKQQNRDQIIKVYYDQIKGKSKVIIDATDTIKNSTECFQTSTGDNVTLSSNCTSYILPASMKKVFFKFRYVKPSIPKRIFGDISYNVIIQDGGSACQTPTFTIADNLDNHVSNSTVPAMHYFRAADDQNIHVSHTSSTSGKFFHSKDLEDVSEVWKTGFHRCESRGRMAPYYDDSIPLDCK